MTRSRRRLWAHAYAFLIAFGTSVWVGVFGGPLWAQVIGAFVGFFVGLLFMLDWAYRPRGPHGMEFIVGPPPNVDPNEIGWMPPKKRRGDEIVEGTICRPEGTSERVVMLVQRQRHMITGFDRPIIITPGSHVHVTVGGVEEMPKI